MWRHLLRQQQVQSLYFNAWETDFSSDPLIALIGELGASMGALNIGKSTAAGKQLEKLKKVGARVAVRAVPALIKAGTLGILDLSDVAEEAISSATEKIAEEEIKRYVESKESIERFRRELELFSQKLAAQNKTTKPLVIVIDELDRCRPDYAIKVLETVKHLFSVSGVVFVIATDSRQLSNAIRHVYGLDVASDDYLRRFFDFSVSLPEPSTRQFVEMQFSRFGFEEFFKGRTHAELRYDRDQAITALGVMFDATKCSLRDQQKCFTLMAVSLRGVAENTYLHPLLLSVLIVLRIKRPSLYEQFVAGEIGPQEVIATLSDNPAGKAFFASPRGLGPMMRAQLIVATKKRASREALVADLRSRSSGDDQEAILARHVLEIIENYAFRNASGAIKHVLPRIELFARKEESDDY